MAKSRAAKAPATPEQVAAIDLGSNSFHMVVARPEHGRLHVLDRLRERVALAEGLDDAGALTPEATERALACLDRFGQRLAHMPPQTVRAVGTSALRQAKNAKSFLAAARRRLGYEIEVVGGLEEARLIYLGVSHSHGSMPSRRLVIDIGGGSTECILGEGFAPLVSDSFRMGCIRYSRRFFPKGDITREAMRRARLKARLQLEGVASRYRKLGWDGCIGASGTIQAVYEILKSNDWAQNDGIQPEGLHNLRRLLIEQGHVDGLDIAGLAADRAPVIAGGVAVLCGVFDSFEIEELQPSTGALREGLLYDLLGRIRHEDVRDTTIRSLFERYHIDTAHAARVLNTAQALLEGTREGWALESVQLQRALGWAAQLFEIGLSIAYSGHHRHGAYILANADLPGFSLSDQELLSALILGHRRKPRRALLDALPAPEETRRIVCLLRLAVLLHRSRSPEPLPPIGLRATASGLALEFPEGWLDEHALTAENLATEAQRLKALDLELTW